MKAITTYGCCDPRAAAVALGRWGLGMLFLFNGLGKFMMGVSIFAQGLETQFEKTILPTGLVTAFGHVLPFVEVALGILLILGIARDVVLFVTGLLLLALTLGMILQHQIPVVFYNTSYLFMAATLLFASKYDRWILMPECCRWGGVKDVEEASPRT